MLLQSLIATRQNARVCWLIECSADIVTIDFVQDPCRGLCGFDCELSVQDVVDYPFHLSDFRSQC